MNIQSFNNGYSDAYTGYNMAGGKKNRVRIEEVSSDKDEEFEISEVSSISSEEEIEENENTAKSGASTEEAEIEEAQVIEESEESSYENADVDEATSDTFKEIIGLPKMPKEYGKWKVIHEKGLHADDHKIAILNYNDIRCKLFHKGDHSHIGVNIFGHDEANKKTLIDSTFLLPADEVENTEGCRIIAKRAIKQFAKEIEGNELKNAIEKYAGVFAAGINALHTQEVSKETKKKVVSAKRPTVEKVTVEKVSDKNIPKIKELTRSLEKAAEAEKKARKVTKEALEKLKDAKKLSKEKTQKHSRDAAKHVKFKKLHHLPHLKKTEGHIVIKNDKEHPYDDKHVAFIHLKGVKTILRVYNKGDNKVGVYSFHDKGVKKKHHHQVKSFTERNVTKPKSDALKKSGAHELAKGVLPDNTKEKYIKVAERAIAESVQALNHSKIKNHTVKAKGLKIV